MRSMIIIGAGLAGLTAGCYGQINGYKIKIFEQHTVPGGYCTSWRRKGYTFDFAMDWLNGLNSADRDSKMWQELGYLQGRKVTYFDELLRVVEENGEIRHFYNDPVKLEQELLKLTSYEEDRKQIRRLCQDIAKLIKAPPFDFTKPEALYKAKDRLKVMLEFLPVMRILISYNMISISDYAKKFIDPRLRKIASYFYYDPIIPQAQFTPMFTLVGMNKKSIGYPEGGGEGLSKHLEQKFKEVGGEIKYNTKVEKIIVHNNKAVGVRLENGEEHFADIIVSAGDSRQAIFNLLEGVYVNEPVNSLYSKGPIYPSMVRVYLGVDQDFKDTPDVSVHLLKVPMKIGGLYKKEIQESLMIKHYSNCDPSFAPPGKSVLSCGFFADYDYWKHLHTKDQEAYKKEKDAVAEEVIDRLETIYPGIRGRIEVVDVVTPVTCERYTGNYRGAAKAWIEDLTDVPDYTKKIGMTLPGLEDFYLIGQWIVFGGMVRVVASGRHLIKALCQQDKKEFVSQLEKKMASPKSASELSA
jgi:phytoene dehydrogenase-like protein